MLATMKFTMNKFQLVRKYANYPTWDEKQNAPFYYERKNNQNSKRVIKIYCLPLLCLIFTEVLVFFQRTLSS